MLVCMMEAFVIMMLVCVTETFMQGPDHDVGVCGGDFHARP